MIPADVTSEDSVAAAVASARSSSSASIDIVVNNAGGTNFMVPFADMRLSGWDKIMRLNGTSVVYVCRAVGRHLLERARGSVINVASVGGLAARPDDLAPYGAAKAAVVSLTSRSPSSGPRYGIRVNALCPAGRPRS